MLNKLVRDELSGSFLEFYTYLPYTACTASVSNTRLVTETLFSPWTMLVFIYIGWKIYIAKTS